MSIWIIFKIIGSLALLIYGMKVMSEALQKMAGSQLRHILGTMTKNRFTGLITGMFVTASVQSSTAPGAGTSEARLRRQGSAHGH